MQQGKNWQNQQASKKWKWTRFSHKKPQYLKLTSICRKSMANKKTDQNQQWSIKIKNWPKSAVKSNSGCITFVPEYGGQYKNQNLNLRVFCSVMIKEINLLFLKSYNASWPESVVSSKILQCKLTRVSRWWSAKKVTKISSKASQF